MEFNNSYYKSPSGQLSFEVDDLNGIVMTYYGNLKEVTVKEYVNFMKALGECMQSMNFGKVLLDLSITSNFSINLRAAAASNINETMVKKAPYFLLAIVKGKSTFDNLATAAALNSARPLLHKNFVEGKLFDRKEDAIKWLKNYLV